MKRPLTLLLLLMVALCPAWAKEPGRVDMPELLAPESRMAALHRFALGAMPDMVKLHDWQEVKKFAADHAGLELRKFQPQGRGPEYVLTFERSRSGLEPGKIPWPPEPLPPGVLDLERSLHFYSFSAEGQPLDVSGSKVRQMLWDYGNPISAVEDLNGDGAPEYLTRRANELKFYDDDGKSVFTEGLEILSSSGHCTFVFNSHPVSWAPGNTWGCEVRKVAGAAGYEIVFGPVAGLREVKAEVAVRWHHETGQWVATPADHPHLKIVRHGRDADAGGALFSKERVLEYPRQGPPTPLKVTVRPDFSELRGVRLNKPWRYQSLAGKTEAELISWFAAKPTQWTRREEQFQESLAVPDLWQRPVREAARHYVRAHSSPMARATCLFDFTAGEEPPPTEGEVELDSGSGGCGGGSMHRMLLHCAPGASFLLAYDSVYAAGFDALWLANPVRGRIHRVPLDDAEARQILQLVWYMTQVRGRSLVCFDDAFAPMSTTSYSYKLMVRAGGASRTLDADYCYYYDYPGDLFPGKPSTPAACASIVNWFLRHEVVERLGQRWEESDSRQDEDHRWSEPVEPSAGDVARWKEANRQVLEMHRQGLVGADFASSAVWAAGEGGWAECRPVLEGIQAQHLRALTPGVQQMLELDGEIERWEQKLGKDAGVDGFRKRSPQYVPEGLDPLMPGLTPAPIDPATRARFAEVDALHARHVALEKEMSKPDGARYDLLSSVKTALEQIAMADDPAALMATAEKGRLEWFAARRLGVLAPEKALVFARSCDMAKSDAFQWFAARLEVKKLRGDFPGSAEARRRLFEIVDEGMAAEEALEVVVPRGDEARWPGADIDVALVHTLTTPTRATNMIRPVERLAMALARRQGAAAWETLFSLLREDPPAVQKAMAKSGNRGRSVSPEAVLPALCWLAQQVGEPQRAALAGEVLKMLRGPNSDYGRNAALWAAWLLGAEELKGEVERQAVRSPQDYEGPAGVHGASNRTHMGRRLAAIWNEEDALTRAKLLALLTVKERKRFESVKDGTIAIVAERFRVAADGLGEAQRESLRAFVAGLENGYPQAQAELATVCAAVR